MSPPLPKHLEMYRPGSSTMSSSNNIFKPMQQFLDAQSPMQQKPPGPPPMMPTNHSNSLNRLSIREQNSSKSQSKLDPPGQDVDSSIKELKERIYKIGKTLYEHERMLNDIRGEKLYSSTVSGSSVNEMPVQMGPTLTEVSKLVQQELEFERQSAHTKILTSIDELRREISDKFVRKEDYQLNFFGELQDIRNKVHEGDKIIMESLRREIDSIKLISYDSSRGSSNRVEKDIMELRQQIENLKAEQIGFKHQLEEQQQPFVTTTRRFSSPRLVRYKETLQAMSSTFEPVGD